MVTGGAIFPGGGTNFAPTKNYYKCPSRQNVYPKMMINNVLNRRGTLYAHFKYSDGTSD